MASEPVFVLPGDTIDPSLIPSNPKKPLRLGPGLRVAPPSDVIPTLAGQFVSDRQKNAIRVEAAEGRYIPRAGERVIGTIFKSTADAYSVMLADYVAPCSLPHLAFEGASRKTRPNLNTGDLVYARVAIAHKHLEPELECLDSSTGKSDDLGPLAGGMLYTVSLGFARRLLMPRDGQVVVLDELAAAGLQFETATGRNGRFWVDSTNVKTILAVGRAIQETDTRRLDLDDQKKLVRRIIQDLG